METLYQLIEIISGLISIFSFITGINSLQQLRATAGSRTGAVGESTARQSATARLLWAAPEEHGIKDVHRRLSPLSRTEVLATLLEGYA